jgi:fructokinase
MYSQRVRIGIDLGGTKIEAVAIDERGAIVDRIRRPTPREDYEGTVQVLVDLVREIDRRLGATPTVGIGIPGTISAATGLVKNANSTWLNGRPLGRDVDARLGRPARFANDANCFALSEAVDGAGAGAPVVFGVILGTGTGGGIAIGGAVVTGANAIAGEWGHNPLPWMRAEEWPGRPCYCGRLGCIETFLSGPALADDYRRTAGETLDASAVAAHAAAGDPHASAVLARYEDRLARALASVVNVLDPDVIVLGGGLSNLERLYTVVPSLWAQWIFSDTVSTRLLRAAHGDSSGVRGAAWLW